MRVQKVVVFSSFLTRLKEAGLENGFFYAYQNLDRSLRPLREVTSIQGDEMDVLLPGGRVNHFNLRAKGGFPDCNVVLGVEPKCRGIHKSFIIRIMTYGEYFR